MKLTEWKRTITAPLPSRRWAYGRATGATDTPYQGTRSRSYAMSEYQGRQWTEAHLAHWYHSGPVPMTLSEAWQLARLTAQGPLADAYLFGKSRAQADE